MFNTARSTIPQPIASVLRDYIKNPPDGSIKMLITPEMALEMLTFNTNNRPVTKSRVALYADQMKNGEWRYTRVPVIFSDAGRVIDGQHRLYACVESGVLIACDVAFGAPDESFAFIDVGKARTAGDIFSINGVVNAGAMASMSAVLFDFKRGVNAEGTGRYPTAAELYEFYLKLPRLQESMTVVNWFARSRLASPSVMGAIHYLCAQKNRVLADKFFDAVCHGDSDRSSPASELHARLIRNAAASEKMKKNVLAGMTVTAWNRERRGLTGRGLKFTAGDKLPSVL